MSGAGPDVVVAFWAWVLPASVAAAALAVVAWIADRLLPRGRFHELRTALWLAVVVRLCLPPQLAAPIDLAAAQVIPAADAAATLPKVPGATWAMFFVWAAGALLAFVIATSNARRTRRTWLGERSLVVPEWLEECARRISARTGLRHVPRLHLAAGIPGPAVVGAFRPVVVLPAGLVAGGPKTDLDHALFHELMHLRRRDPLADLLGTALRALAWFHPAVHLAAVRLAALREVGCDLAVARLLGPETAGYRGTLLRLAGAMMPLRVPAPLGFLGRRSRIVERLESLRRAPAARSRLGRAGAAALLAVLVACSLPAAREAPGPAFLPPSIQYQDLQGCLQKRLYVLALLAQDRAGAPR